MIFILSVFRKHVVFDFIKESRMRAGVRLSPDSIIIIFSEFVNIHTHALGAQLSHYECVACLPLGTRASLLLPRMFIFNISHRACIMLYI